MKDRSKAVLLMLLSALSFSLMQLAVKLSAMTVETMQQVFFRNLIGLVISFVLLKKKHLPLFGERKYQLPLFARSFFGFCGMCFLFIATAGARQADVALLSRTTPIWVSIFAWLLLKEKISKIQVPVIALCMLGAFAAIQPSFDSDIKPLVFALLTSVCSGVAYTMIAYCKGRVNPLTVIFQFCIFSTIAAGILMIPDFVVPTARDLLILFFIGLFGAGGQLGLTYAMQWAPASEVSIYDYAGIIFSAIWGYIALHETLTMPTVIGALLITAGGAWSFFYNRRQGEKTA
ncbi:DMT family transporter [Oscillibacter sp. PC13]|uniref:DMT family transporter n=1 Tax=Oscillibacter sp. PC13 TaxID=1855299 RepID=UPI000B84E245|nr:DMT family transporter [Oscillibacter sp. PC13]